MRTFDWLHSSSILLVALLPVFYGPASVAIGCLLAYAVSSVVFALNRSSRRWSAFAATVTLLGVAFELSSAWSAPDFTNVPLGDLEGVGVVAVEAYASESGRSRFELAVKTLVRSGIETDVPIKVLVRNFPGSSPKNGEVWRWRGGLERAVAPPGAPRFVLTWKSGRFLGWENSIWEARASILETLSRTFERLPSGASALSQALLWGRTDVLTTEEKAAFRDAGCSHVLALSGMHLGFLAIALSTAMGRWTARGSRFVALQIVLLAFCFLAGPIASLWRAWLTTLLAGAARLAWKSVRLEDVLVASFVACCVLWPSMASSMSLELSFLALWGILRWGQTFEYALRPVFGRTLAAAIGSSVAATISTFALTGWIFQRVAVVGIFASIPLVAITTLHLVVSLAYLVFSLSGMTAFESGFRILAAIGYDACFAVARWAARFPALDFGYALAAATSWGLFSFAVFLYKKRHRSSKMPERLNYDSRVDLQAFLDRRGLNALKRWGQNFLINKGARSQIVGALELEANEAVWEIGPGLGALTHHLVEKGHPVKAFEIDPGYVEFLNQEWGNSPTGFEVVEGDVIKTWRAHRGSSPVKIVGNLPYNASSAIIADLIEGDYFPPIFVVTVQKEMAERMGASTGSKNYSSFSVLCQSVFDVKTVVVLKPGSFYPVPEVTSWVVKLVPHRRYEGLDYHDFSVLVRECFAHRRKTLRNNLSTAAAALRVERDTIEAAFQENSIDLSLRAETLTIDQFVRVYRAIRRSKV